MGTRRNYFDPPLLTFNDLKIRVKSNILSGKDYYFNMIFFPLDYFSIYSERSDFIILSRAKHAGSLLTARGLSQPPNSRRNK